MAKKKETEEKAAPEAGRSLLRNVWLVGLGTVAATEEGAVKLYRYLLEKGEAFEGDHQDGIDSFKEKAQETAKEAKERVQKGWSQMSEAVDGTFSSALSRVGVTGKELGALRQRVDELATKVDELKPELTN